MRVRRRKRGGGLPPQFKKKKAPPFESKVEGGNARRRPDRMARGGKVKAEKLADAEPVSNTQHIVPPEGAEKQKYQGGGAVRRWKYNAPRPPWWESEHAGTGKRAGDEDEQPEPEKKQFGGRVSHHTVRHVTHADPLRSRTITTRSTHRDRMAGEFKRGGKADDDEKVEKRQAGGDVPMERQPNLKTTEPGLTPGGASKASAARRAGIPQRKDGGRLTAARRQSLPSSSFALPGKGTGPKGAGAGSYPIPDASHARNALARVSQHGSSEQKAKVRAAVHRKFPGIGQSESD